MLTHPWVKAHCCAAEDARPAWFDHWYCDVGGEGCLRPTELTHSAEQQRCWAYKDEYMVCEVCYQSGHTEHAGELVLYEPIGAESVEAQGEAAGADSGSEGGGGGGGVSGAEPALAAEALSLNDKVRRPGRAAAPFTCPRIAQQPTTRPGNGGANGFHSSPRP